MIQTLLLALVLASDPFPMARAEAELSVEITVPELQAHVYRLASREFLGRRGPGAARTAEHLAKAFERLHLRPAFGESYVQSIPWLVGGRTGFLGRNVAAILPGSDPQQADEWILLAAHYDHLGAKDDHYYPGADDNASGVAMLLEVAERLALGSEKPRRTIVFASFDQEETGLLGSTHFAAHPPLPLSKLKSVIVADMLGRSMANVMDEYVFALGSETAPELRRLIEEVPPGEGLKIGRLGADLIGTRSDYGPFRDRRVPFLFFSTGQHPDYHRVTDLPDRIDYHKLRRISLWIGALARRLASDSTTPRWSEKEAVPDLEEARTVLLLLSRVLEKPEVYPLKDSQRELVQKTREKLNGFVERRRVTPEERSWLVWTTRLMLVTVF